MQSCRWLWKILNYDRDNIWLDLHPGFFNIAFQETQGLAALDCSGILFQDPWTTKSIMFHSVEFHDQTSLEQYTGRLNSRSTPTYSLLRVQVLRLDQATNRCLLSFFRSRRSKCLSKLVPDTAMLWSWRLLEWKWILLFQIWKSPHTTSQSSGKESSPPSQLTEILYIPEKLNHENLFILMGVHFTASSRHRGFIFLHFSSIDAIILSMKLCPLISL